MSNSVWPHRRQPTRLPRPWDSPGKNTGVGCHFLLQCMKVRSESEVAQSCLTLSDPTDCSLPGSSVHGIFQARALEWVPLPSSVLYNTAAWIQPENLNQYWLTVQILREVLFNSLHSVPRLRSGSFFSVLFCGKVYFPFNFIFT